MFWEIDAYIVTALMIIHVARMGWASGWFGFKPIPSTERAARWRRFIGEGVVIWFLIFAFFTLHLMGVRNISTLTIQSGLISLGCGITAAAFFALYGLYAKIKAQRRRAAVKTLSRHFNSSSPEDRSTSQA